MFKTQERGPGKEWVGTRARDRTQEVSCWFPAKVRRTAVLSSFWKVGDTVGLMNNTCVFRTRVLRAIKVSGQGFLTNVPGSRLSEVYAEAVSGLLKEQTRTVIPQAPSETTGWPSYAFVPVQRDSEPSTEHLERRKQRGECSK